MPFRLSPRPWRRARRGGTLVCRRSAARRPALEAPPLRWKTPALPTTRLLFSFFSPVLIHGEGRASRAVHACRLPEGMASGIRSEEHTSELQSLRHLVCRLLLEKKNNQVDEYQKPRRLVFTEHTV